MVNTFSFQTILTLVTLLFIKIFISYVNKDNKKLKLPPSPLALPIIGHLHLLKQPLHHSLSSISNRYGPATLLHFGSRRALIVSSRTLAEQCLTTHDLAFANRAQLPSIMLPDLIGTANYGPHWRNCRQIAKEELLSIRQIQASSDIRTTQVRDMVHRLFKSYKMDQKLNGSNHYVELDLRTLLFELMLNMMMMMIAGKRLCSDNIKDLVDMKQYREAIEDWFDLTGAAKAEDFIPLLRMLDLGGVMKKMRRVANVNEAMVNKLIEDHQQEGVGKRKTMIGHMLQLQQEDPDNYSDFVIRNICMNLMIGGADTVKTSLEWTLANLLNNPSILTKAAAEIDAHVGSQRLVQESDMDNLPFLNCILKESLRIHPIAPLLDAHESREEVTVGGYNIPKGTMLIVNIYHIQRDPKNWDDPTVFKPERFENENTDEKWMIPFGMGRRKCPGDVLAMREMGLILGTLIQFFDWKRVGDEPVNMAEGHLGLTLPMAVPLHVLYRPRLNMMEVLSKL
ncbi:cytochrome P450 81Q32-like [Carex rostrata]